MAELLDSASYYMRRIRSKIPTCMLPMRDDITRHVQQRKNTEIGRLALDIARGFIPADR